jgi:transposase-like protein
MSSVLSDKHFHDERAAYAFVEARLWPNGPNGPSCPHCGNADQNRIVKMAGKSTRIGVHNCRECRKPFTVKVGTVFESSHVPLRLWLQAVHLLCSSKKGISSNQLHRILGVTLKTAWFMSHRIREAMRDGSLAPMGGSGSVVEADETFIGKLDDVPRQKSGYADKNVVLTLVERGGSARSFHIDNTSVAQIVPIVRANIARETELRTDEAIHYRGVGREFASHEAVVHSRKEYVRGDVHTNTVEGYYSIFKRGMKGVYQHCAQKHLHRYLSEFDFRYSNRVARGVDDVERADRALKGIVGKRLTYRTTH